MTFTERDVKKLTAFVLIVLLLILVYIIIKPVIVAAVGGLILSYVFLPFYVRVRNIIKNRTLSASLVTFVILVCLGAIVWFMTPLIMQQVFEIFTASQKVDVLEFIKAVLPSSTDQFAAQMSVTLTELIGKASSGVLNYLLGIFLDLPLILLNLFIVGFVFFFGLRDAEQLKAFFKGLSPFTESKEKVLVAHFKDMTDSVIFGQIIIGIVQGLLAGVGFLVFGIDNALVLTILAIFFSIIPFLGPAIIWVPVAIYLFTLGNDSLALGYVAYNLLIVSLIDNILRSYLISRKTKVSAAIVFVGMIGGVFVFGILGLIIGPLVLAYLLTLLESFKDKSIYSLFSDNG